MYVVYMFCKASPEGDPAGYVIAVDDIAELNELDYTLDGSECLWIVPNSF